MVLLSVSLETSTVKMLPLSARLHLGRRQAGAVAGDRGADGDAVGRVAAADREAAAVARHELADVGDDAGEHGREGITFVVQP